jgi:hypothetical protein
MKMDIMEKWKKVDMAEIYRMQASFDLETGTFK